MPLPGSGSISAGQIQTEFGGSNPISISEYYGAASGVPTVGQLSWSDFHGTSSVPALDVSTSPSSVSGSGTGSGTEFVASDPCTAVRTGSVSPYTFAWTYVSGDTQIQASNTANQTTAFTANIPQNGNYVATWAVTVTDGNSNTASANVSIVLINDDFN